MRDDETHKLKPNFQNSNQNKKFIKFIENQVKKIGVMGLILFLYSMITYSYRFNISPNYLYYGLVYHPLSLTEIFVSLFFLLAPLMIIPYHLRLPSDYAIWALYFFSYFPSVIVSVYTLGLVEAIKLLVLLFAGLLAIFYSKQIIIKIMGDLKINFYRLEIFLGVSLFFIALIFTLKLCGFSLNLDFTSIYDRRLEARSINSRLSAYFLVFVRQCVVIIGVYLGVVKKKYWLLLLSGVISINIFSFDGTKTSIILPIIFVSFAFILLLKKQRTILVLLIPALIMVTLGVVEFTIGPTNYISDYLVRRSFVIPGLLNGFYWDFFSDHKYALLTDSILRNIIEPVYNKPVTFVIGEHYFNRLSTNANTGIWMGGFSHFGITGVFVVSIIAGLILGQIDRVTKSTLFIWGSMVSLFFGIIWSEQMFHTSLLTGGIIYHLVLLFCIKRFVHARNCFVQKMKA